MDLRFIATVKDGVFNLGTDYNRKRLRMALRQLNGKTVTFTVHPKKHTRSLKQNGYYWGAIVPLFVKMFNTGIATEEQKWSPEDVHEKLKMEFNFCYRQTKEGMQKLPRSTADLTVGEFAEYLFRIEEYCKENGIYIPTVEEYYQAQFA